MVPAWMERVRTNRLLVQNQRVSNTTSLAERRGVFQTLRQLALVYAAAAESLGETVAPFFDDSTATVAEDTVGAINLVNPQVFDPNYNPPVPDERPLSPPADMVIEPEYRVRPTQEEAIVAASDVTEVLSAPSDNTEVLVIINDEAALFARATATLNKFETLLGLLGIAVTEDFRYAMEQIVLWFGALGMTPTPSSGGPATPFAQRQAVLG